jgi:death-on-curing protein
VRYLTLSEALVIAEVVTGTSAVTLAKSPRIGLLDSALHAPEAGFGDFDLYPSFPEKAAVLVVRVAVNHALIDGNKRLAWGCLNVFCSLNGYEIDFEADDAVETMFQIANGEMDEVGMVEWLEARLRDARD